ncbi:MAG: citrate synthase [Clostridiales bacterium]|nr:citrate synthase [Clostridiales bacterium]
MINVSDSIIENEAISLLCRNLQDNYYIDKSDFAKYGVKRGLRNADGTGVMAGLTKICSVEGYYIDDGERIPKEGRLYYRGIDVNDIVNACLSENRFGFEEVLWLLLFGVLPTEEQLKRFNSALSKMRELPDSFTEDMIMKAPSPNIMNKIARAVLALYSYDDNPDDNSIENVLNQSLYLTARLPSIMSYAYQVKKRHYYHKSMYIHPPKPDQHTAEVILNSIRSDKQFTDEEAKLLDICLILHAEHGGGNNSTFATRVLSSSGTDTYAAIAAGIGALKGPKHGGANLKVAEMVKMFKENCSDTEDEGQVADYIRKILRKEGGDGSGLVYGMGHAVYTLSDPRAVILKSQAEKFSKGTEFEEEFKLLSLIEKLTPELIKKSKPICANVDLYSGLIYKMLRIPEDLYTPLFATARMAGWCAHRIEELFIGGRIIRPAYKSLAAHTEYVPIAER